MRLVIYSSQVWQPLNMNYMEIIFQTATHFEKYRGLPIIGLMIQSVCMATGMAGISWNIEEAMTLLTNSRFVMAQTRRKNAWISPTWHVDKGKLFLGPSEITAPLEMCSAKLRELKVVWKERQSPRR